MDLSTALALLATVHTQDNIELGFTVEMGAVPSPSVRSRYVEAWRAVRRELGLRSRPPITQMELVAYASRYDGVCKVVKIGEGTSELFPPDADVAGRGPWDYFLMDEQSSFPFSYYGIQR